MFTLIIDTSTEKGIVVIAHGYNVVFEEKLDLRLVKGSTLLFSVIEKGFATVKISINDLKGIALATGPGSFTGIRVAAAVAKGMAFPKSLPLIGFSSFSGFISKEEGPFITLIDAKIGGAHIQMRENRGGQIIDFETQFVKEFPLNKKIISPSFGKLKVAGEEMFPDGTYLAQVVERKYLNKEFDLHFAYLGLNSKEKDGIVYTTIET